MSKNSDLWQLFQSINEWIRFSDTKAVALLGVQGLFVGFLVENRASWANLAVWQLVLFAVGLLLNATSIGCAFLCLNPNLKHNGSSKSVIYFGSIARNFATANDYKEELKESYSTVDQQANQLCHQIYVNSRIADRKFRFVAYSLRLFLGSLISWSLVIILHL